MNDSEKVFAGAATNPDLTIKVTDEQLAKKSASAKENLESFRQQQQELDEAEEKDTTGVSATSIGDFVRFLHHSFLPDIADRDKTRATILLDNTRNELNARDDAYIHTELQDDVEFPSLADYCEVEKPFAEGGQGTISRAVDKTLRRTIAIKSLRKEILDKPALRKAFVTEALITAQLEHPAIVPIHGLLGDDAHGIHQSMKLIKGHTLKQELQQFIALRRKGNAKISSGVMNRLFNERIELLLKVCDAVAYAHSRDIIHCDLKPENIMIGEYGEVYVMDWGLARRFRDENGQLIRPPAGAPLDGTPRFMPAEVFMGQPRDERTDIFALGLILFEMITLRRGFPGKDIPEVIRKIKSGEREPVVNRFGYSINRDLTAIIEKATAFAPEDRYQHVTELSDDLRRYLDGFAVSARPENPLEKLFRAMRLYSRTLVLLTLASWAVCGFFITRQLRIRNQQAAAALAEERAAAEVQRQNIAELELNRQLDAMDAKVIRSAIRLSNRLTEMAGTLRQLGEQAARNLTYHGAFQMDEKDGIIPIRPYQQLNARECVFSSVYNDYVKTDSCACQIPPGSDPARVEFELERLAPLSDDLRNLVMNSTDYSRLLPWKEQERLLVEEGLLLRRAYLGLADTGLHVAYPGGGSYPDDYDNRKRGWFKDAAAVAAEQHNLAATWSKPYLDIAQKQQVMTCSIPILDRKGEFLGTIAFDLFFEAFTRELRENGNGDGEEIIAKYLCDNEGTLLCQVPVHTTGIEPSIPAEVEMQLRRRLSFLFRKNLEKNSGGYGHLKAREGGHYVYYHYAYLPGVKFYLIEKSSLTEIERLIKNTKEQSRRAPHPRRRRARSVVKPSPDNESHPEND